MAYLARFPAVLFSVFVGTVTQVHAFCLNDQELRDVLLGSYVYGIGQTVGVCARKYPSLRPRLLDAFRRFEDAYSEELRETDKRSVAAFEGNFPGRGIQTRDANDAAANREGLVRAERFSSRECENVAEGIDAMIVLDDWATLVSTSPATLFFSDERSRIQPCVK